MVCLDDDKFLQDDCTLPEWLVMRETLPVICINSGMTRSLVLLKCLTSGQLHLYAVLFMGSPIHNSSESKGPNENPRIVD